MSPASAGEPRSALVSWLRRFAALWGFALFVLVVAIAFRAVILPFVLGGVVAYILAPLVARLARRIPRWSAVVAVYVALAGAIGLFFVTFAPYLSADVARLFREAPVFLDHVRRDYVPRADAWLEAAFPSEHDEEPAPRPERKLTMVERGPGQYEISLEGMELEIEPTGKGRYVVGPRSDEHRTRLTDLLGEAASATESELKSVLLVGRRFIAGVLKGFTWFILTFMVAAYLLVDLARVFDFLRSLVPESRRRDFDELAQEIDRGLAGVIRGQAIICLVNATLTTIGLVLFHVKYPLLLGLVAGAFSFIPVFGSIVSSVPIVIVALASGPIGLSVSTGLAVLAWIVGIHLLEANYLNPKIIGGAAKIHPVVVVFALLVGETSGGLIGALLAVPAASIVQAVFVFLRRRTPAEVS